MCVSNQCYYQTILSLILCTSPYFKEFSFKVLIEKDFKSEGFWCRSSLKIDVTNYFIQVINANTVVYP